MNENINNTQICIKYEDLLDEIENPLLKVLCNNIASTKKSHAYLAESYLYSDFVYKSDMAKILVNMMDDIQFTLLRMDFSAITFFYNYNYMIIFIKYFHLFPIFHIFHKVILRHYFFLLNQLPHL